MTESLIVGYAPGAWRVVATTHGVVMVDAAVPPTAVAALWTTLDEEVDLHRVLDALTVGTGGTLANLPPFAVVLREDGATRVAVRGPLVASATGGAGAVELSGEGVTTWNERLFVAGTVRVAAVDAEPATFDLAVRDGVVLADAVHVRWLESVELPVPTTTDAAPAPVTTDEPEAEWSAAPAKLVESEAPAEAETPGDAEPPVEEPAPSTPRAVPAIAPTRPAVGQPWVPSATVTATPAATPVTPGARPAIGQPWVPPVIAEPQIDPQTVSASEGDTEEPPAHEASDSVEDVPVLVPPVAPWLVAPAAPLVASTPSEGQASDDALADTRVSVAGAVLREPEPEPAVVIGRPGDHDGATISIAEARALRGDRGDTTPPPLAPPRPPAPGRLRLSTGDVISLDRTVVIGRRPRSTRITGTDLPRLVPVDSPLHDISRSHLELRVEGDAIIATDLQTTNGTMLLRRATAPTRLHPGEPTVVVPGDVLDLGDGVRVAIEDLA